MVVGETTKLRQSEYGSRSTLGLPFHKTHSDNTHSSSPFGLLSSSKAQKLIPPLSSPAKSTNASSPYCMWIEFLSEEKEVKSLVASKQKKKLLENHDVDKIMTYNAVSGHQEDGVKDLSEDFILVELGISLT